MTDECCITKNGIESGYVGSDVCPMVNNGAKTDAVVTDKIDAKGCENEKNNTNAAISFSNKYVACMPVKRHATHYNMNHKKRGQALIFNHEHFDIPSLKSRAGTNVDTDGFCKALKRLGFEVSVYKDCRLLEILEHIKKAADADHSDNDCIAIAILSHGEHGYIYAKDVQYKLDSLWHYFTAHECPTLAGKPKMFFIQACQGDRLDAGILLQKSTVTETDGDSSSVSYRIPLHADFLFAYSTIPGFYSWRNTSDGSWYMQSLIQELNINGTKLDMLTLLTFVSQRVATNFESNVPNTPIMDRQKQIPCINSMLTRILLFTEKKNTSKGG